MPNRAFEPGNDRLDVARRPAGAPRLPARVTVRPGRADPLGATWDGQGTNFAIFSGIAERVELCLFDRHDAETRIPMSASEDHVWHCQVRGVGPGQRYGYRVHGPWDPSGSGARCDPARLLLDPYARAIDGETSWHPSVFPDQAGRQAGPAADGDTAPFVPRSVVIDPRFDWGDDRPPRRPLAETVIYEVHVKGFTARHPAIPEPLRGTYAGLAHPAAIDHLLKLGITAVELLPIHQFVHDARLASLGLRNYWGYNSIGFFAPHGGYAAAGDGGGQVAEFKWMVKALHAAGLEVILDVVYNHTGESDELGPILSFKGIDNAAYYRLLPGARERYQDVTATGNTLDARQPAVQRLVLESLRYWVDDMHVDGFRFDLAAALGRGNDAFDPHAPLLEAIHRDPIIGALKVIAEPWDAGDGGYHAGGFSEPWSEWNDRFRDTVRDLWRGRLSTAADLGFRLTGSSDRYAAAGRTPTAGINFVTAHDGFTLADLVAYEIRHNLANGENNRDGAVHNHSQNFGIEGPTDDPAIRAARARAQRNLLATLLLSHGVPMLLGGDELGRTQSGNNNAYCQDNETSWLDWDAADRELLDFTRRLIALRHDHPAFRRRQWVGDGSPHPIAWFTLDGEPMTAGDWESSPFVGLGLRLGGEDLAHGDDPSCPDDAFHVVIHAADGARSVRLPAAPLGQRWQVVIDTAARRPFPARGRTVSAGELLSVDGRSLVVLRGVGDRV